MPRCKHCRKHFDNRAVVNGHDEVLHGYCSRGCFQADNPEGYAAWLEEKRRSAERQTAMEKKLFEILRSAVRWYWGLRRKSMPAFWTVTVLLVVGIGTIVFLVRSGQGYRIGKAVAGRNTYGSVKTADLVEVAEECKDRMEWFQSTADRRYSDIGEVPSAEWVAEQTKDQPWMKSCGTKCKKGGTYSIALAKDEDGRDKVKVACSVHGTTGDVHLGMDEGPDAVRLCHHLQVERIVHSFEQRPIPDFQFDQLAFGDYGCPTTGKLAIVAKRTGELYDGIGEVVDVSGTKCSLHGDVFGCTEHEECVRLNEGLSEYWKKVAWKRKQEGWSEPQPEPKTEPEAKPRPESKAKPAPESAPEPTPAPKAAESKESTVKTNAPKPASTPTPAKKTTLTDLADRQATAYKEGTKTVEQIIEVIKSPKLTEPQRKRLRELLEERGVPLAEAERKAREEAKRKAVEAKRQAAEEAKRKAAEEAEARRKAAEEAEARRKADEEAEAKRKAAEEAEARRKEAEARKEAEFKERRQKAEAERLKRQEEDRKRREEADRLAKEEAEREQKRKDEEDRNRQKALDEIAKSMQKLSEAAARMDGRDDEEDDEEEEEEEDADTPFFRSGGVQTETLLEERRAVVEEQRRRAAAAEAQRRAAAAEAQRRAAAAEAQRRAAEQRKREEARKAQQMAAQADPYAISPFSGDGTIEDDEPQQLVPSVRSATPPAMPDAMVEQLAAGIKMSVQGGQMTAAQAAFMLDNATLSAAQKAKVRKLLAAEGIKLPGGK